MYKLVKKYKTKPCEIIAMQYTYDNFEALKKFTEGAVHGNQMKMMDGPDYETYHYECFVDTLEGVMTAKEGDYIIRGLRGEYYPCKPDVFKKKYEEI